LLVAFFCINIYQKTVKNLVINFGFYFVLNSLLAAFKVMSLIAEFIVTFTKRLKTYRTSAIENFFIIEICTLSHNRHHHWVLFSIKNNLFSVLSLFPNDLIMFRFILISVFLFSFFFSTITRHDSALNND